MITKLELRAILLFNLLFLSVLSQNCDKIPSSNYRCLEKKANEKCMTFAILRANPHYSSLSNLSSFFRISHADLVEANGFSNDVEFLSEDEPVLIPIECKCSSGGFFEAEVEKISIRGESFYDIADSLEGLTSCNAIREKNPSFAPWNVPEGINVSVPLSCACPASVDSREFLVSYPVKGGDTLSELSVRFNVSQENIASANSKYSASGFKQDGNLVPISTLLIPTEGKPVLDLGRSEESSRVARSQKRRRKRPKMRMIGVYIAIGIVGFFACIAVGAAFFFIHMKKRREEGLTVIKDSADMELQQLSLSIRTTSDKKVSFEGSQYNLDEAAAYTTTPHKMRVMESYTFEDLQKATEDFSSSNLIEGGVFHGRLKGKNIAVKCVPSETVLSRIDYEVLQNRMHRHPNIMRLLGTCSVEGDQGSFIVFEYARNGSLKDWIHGGLAIKSHFIASCSCFLTWNQRVKICLDVATALQHMHHIMNPSYVHRNIRSRNIFLDEDFTAKVGNFGLAKLADDQEAGYSPPAEGAVSPSSDVFAYGVVLLEVLSGKPPATRDGESGDGKLVKLSDEIKRVLQSDDAEELRGWIDSALGDNYSFDAAVMLANLARSCVEDDASSRPNAGEIVEKLLRLVEELPERDQFVICESSCKPLVDAVAKEM